MGELTHRERLFWWLLSRRQVLLEVTRAPSKSLGQRLMEWRPLVAIYESRYWRRSGLFARIAGMPFDEELARLSHEARLDDAHRVLDLACGSGIYSRPFARRLPRGRVAGLDLSEPMLAQARRRARAEGCANLDLVRGSALDLPFRSGCFDVVNCCGAVHLFPDVPRALAEIQRVLAPGGRFTAAVFRRGPSEREVRRAEQRERMMGVHAFSREEFEGRLADAGFVAARFPHEHGIWMLAAAEKPGAASA
jgi:SAM-dependent methyltransferase